MSPAPRVSRLVELDRNLRGVAATRDAVDPYSEAIRQQLDHERQALVALMTPQELVEYEDERHRVRQLLRRME